MRISSQKHCCTNVKFLVYLIISAIVSVNFEAQGWYPWWLKWMENLHICKLMFVPNIGNYGDQNDGKLRCPPENPTWCICKWATAKWIKGEGCNEVSIGHFWISSLLSTHCTISEWDGGEAQTVPPFLLLLPSPHPLLYLGFSHEAQFFYSREYSSLMNPFAPSFFSLNSAFSLTARLPMYVTWRYGMKLYHWAYFVRMFIYRI